MTVGQHRDGEQAQGLGLADDGVRHRARQVGREAAPACACRRVPGRSSAALAGLRGYRSVGLASGMVEVLVGVADDIDVVDR